MRGRRWLRPMAVATIVALLGVALLSGTTRASHLRTKLDRLRDRLTDARTEVQRVQGEASSVSDQIESIDRQAEAVESALAASRALIRNLETDISELQVKVDRETKRVERTGILERNLAIELYKTGGFADLNVLLEAESVADVQQLLELSGTVQGHRVQVMVDAQRARANLKADQAELEDKLGEARAVQVEQQSQAQHLRELRAAKQTSLSKLRTKIRHDREEVDALAERSDEIEEQLAAAAARAKARAEAREAAEAAAAAETAADEVIPSVAPDPAPPSSPGFAWPINGAVTSGFGWRWGRMHEGIDIDCDTGDTVRASKSGRVLISGYDSGGYGYHVVITHSGGFGTLYGHASSLFVSSGQNVGQGQAIMACGSTGASTGSHLHFEIRVNGVPQDPLIYLP